jgi:hypothetical protein
MDLTPYVEQVRRELLVSAHVGGDEARALAERLTAPLEATLRLALLSALSTAAEEITSQLTPGAVDVRMRGGDLGFVVTAPPAPELPHEPGPEAGPEPAPPPIPAAEGDEGATARITLRLPEQLKTRLEDAAGREGFSVNTWLVRAVSRGLDAASITSTQDRRRNRWSGQQYSGWVR